MRVFVLGAGASKAYDASPTNVRMPVAKDFFGTFDRLAISGNPWVLQEGILGYISAKGVANPHAYLRSGLDIEAFHSEVEADLTVALRSSDPIEWYFPLRAYNELVFLFCSTINEIQNGPSSRSHRTLARMLKRDDAVITFNWDTLMDRALAAETCWSVADGYGTTPRCIFDDGWKPVDTPANERIAPLLLKLHGSTNWLTAYLTPDRRGGMTLTHELDPATLHVFQQSTAPYACYAGRYMGAYQPMSYGYYPPNLTGIPGLSAPPGEVFVRSRQKVPWKPEGTAPNEGLVSMPLIIPPVRRKSYGMFGSLFGGLWERAERLLSVADELVVIGYSFPETDTRSDDLFVRAFMRRDTMPRVILVDPSPDRIADRFRSRFGITPDRMTVVREGFGDKVDLARLLNR